MRLVRAQLRVYRLDKATIVFPNPLRTCRNITHNR